MADEFDELLRRSMKTLDDQVPAGYFEGLPNRTLARLEDSSMQTTGSSGTEHDASTGVPPTEAAAPPSAAAREEDSGLHDIRNLASSARMRLSSRRISTSPPLGDEDILASSSAGWKAVALPEPAKMVSLPELSELPTKAEIKAKEKAARDSAKEMRKPENARPVAPIAVASEPPLHLDMTPAPAPIAAPMIGARIAAKKAKSGSRGALFGAVGLGLAAAAGVTIFVATRDTSSQDTAQSVAARESDTKAQPTTAAPPPPAAAPTPAVIATDNVEAKPDPAKSDDSLKSPEGAAAAGSSVVTEVVATPPKTKGKPSLKPGKVEKTIIEVKGPDKKPEKPEPVVGKKSPSKGGDTEPNFEDLLKQNNIKDGNTAKKVALDKKSLSGGDFKGGMAAVAKKAQACYNGTQGTAFVKLTIAPSGQVSKVSVSGPFAGTPVASCVQGAVQGASFPAWDGGPQSFNYSYLLSE